METDPKNVQETERLPESRKLELNGYLTKPTTRLARYPLLLEVVLKKTPEDHPDQTNIPKAIKIIKDFLSKLNEESGRSENRFNLAQLDTQLVFRPGEAVVIFPLSLFSCAVFLLNCIRARHRTSSFEKSVVNCSTKDPSRSEVERSPRVQNYKSFCSIMLFS